MSKHVIDGVEVDLDDDIDPADLDQGDQPRGEDDIDLAALEAQAEADAHLEDDQAEEV